MSENTQAAEAPANAVEASQGNSTEPQSAPQTTANEASGGSSAAEVPAATSSQDASAAPEGSSPASASEGAGEEGEAHEGEDEGGPEGPEANAEGAAADPNRKKRKRRRKKKGPRPEGAPGAQVQGEPGSERPHGKPQREGPAGVFSRFFDGGHAGKRHAFSAGEVVAGRVLRSNEGAFAVDLFGKAIAFVDIFEPHDVPLLPEPAAEAPKPEAVAEPAEGEAAASETRADEAAAADDQAPLSTEPANETALAEVPPSDVATPPEVIAEVSAEAAAKPEATEAAGSEPSEAIEEGSSLEDASPESQESHESAHEETAAEPEPEPPPAPELGTIFRGRIGSVAESGHVVIVNRLIDVPAAKKRIMEAREKRKRVRGLVYGYNRGGFDVLVEGIRVFCPASGLAMGPIESPDDLLGQRLEFTVPPVKAGTHGLVVSRRGILERQQRKAAKQLFRSLAPGQRLKGRVTQIREFGLFVDLGGIEGLVHQSELSFSRGVRPQDAAKVGDEVDVQVLRVGEGQTRKERERVSLSMKALQDDPWGAHADVLEPGSVITGKVVRTTEFGAFIEIAPQIEGLLHISELGRELKHANQALEEGQELRVVVERVDRKVRRISLSKLSQAEEKALAAGTDLKSARPPKPGQQVTVVVDKVDHAGLVVQVPGVFGRRGRGFIPNSEMGTERGTDHRKGFPPGTQIPAKVIGVDRDGGFRFSRKALLVEEEKRAIQDYRREAARQGLGTFGDILRKKLEGGKS